MNQVQTGTTMKFRGVRGATTAESNSAEAILSATRALLEELIAENGIVEDDVASIIFTTTPDLNATFPAKAARDLGWRRTALLGAQEMDVPNSIPRCIRVLIHWNTDKTLDQIRHVYHRETLILRPDLYPDNKLVVEENPQQSTVSSERVDTP